MKISNLILAGMLVLGSGLSGAAMAHGDDHRGYDRGWAPFAQRDARGHQHGRHGHHREYRPKWRHDHRDYRPRYRHDFDDTRYGVHLFFSGH